MHQSPSTVVSFATRPLYDGATRPLGRAISPREVRASDEHWRLFTISADVALLVELDGMRIVRGSPTISPDRDAPRAGARLRPTDRPAERTAPARRVNRSNRESPMNGRSVPGLDHRAARQAQLAPQVTSVTRRRCRSSDTAPFSWSASGLPCRQSGRRSRGDAS